MNLQLFCPYCGHRIQSNIENAVNSIACPGCAQIVAIPWNLASGQPEPTAPAKTHSAPSVPPPSKLTFGILLGFVGLIAWLIPLIGVPLSLYALITSINAHRVQHKMARVGIVLGWIGLGLNAIVVCIAIGNYLGAKWLFLYFILSVIWVYFFKRQAVAVDHLTPNSGQFSWKSWNFGLKASSIGLAALIFVGYLYHPTGGGDKSPPGNGGSSYAPPPTPQQSMSAQEIRDKYRNRVFQVHARWQEKGGLLWLSKVERGKNGSAFMFVNKGEYGLLVTNLHVISPSESLIEGTLQYSVQRNEDRTGIEVDVIARGKGTLDLALLLVRLDGNDWKPFRAEMLPFRDCHEGEGCVAIGNALSAGLSTTTGVISRLDSDNGFIQISAPVSSGNSGGPVFVNRKGAFVGIATSIMNGKNGNDLSQNVNLALPSEYIMQPSAWEFFTDSPLVKELLDFARNGK